MKTNEDDNNNTITDEDIIALKSIRDDFMNDVGNSFSVVEENKPGGIQIGKQNLILITKGRLKGIVYSYQDAVSFSENPDGTFGVNVTPKVISHEYSEEEIAKMDDEWRAEFLTFARKVAILLTLCQLLDEDNGSTKDG